MPQWKYAIERRLDGLRLAPARESEIVDELSQHLDDRYAELRAGGASEDAARGDALAELDDADLVRELTGIEPAAAEPLALGGAGTRGWAGGLWQDLRFGARLLAKDIGPTLVVVLTLGLAMAANAIVFGFADLLILRPLPIANATRVMTIFGFDPRQGSNRRTSVSIPDYLDVKSQNTSFADVGAMTRRQVSLTGAGEPVAVLASYVTANMFGVWGIDAFAGRTLQSGDDAADRSNVAVLSHRFWTARFAADPAILGRSVTLNGRSYSVLGILPSSIELGNIGLIDIWLPLEITEGATRADRALAIFALLKPEATLSGANAELATISERLERAYPVTNKGWRLRGMSLRESTVGGSTWIIMALLGLVVALVLLAACANVATVMLARASARRREIAVRLALGATRARLIRQLVSEGLLLGIASGAVGVLLAHLGLTAFRLLSLEPYFQLVQVNSNLLAFAVALSLITPVVFGLVPAVQSSRPDLNEDLKEGGRSGVSPARGNRMRAGLLVAQVGFALAVLIVSGLIVRTVMRLERVPLGVNGRGMLTMRVRFDPPKYPDEDARFRAIESIVERLASTPGIAAAAAVRSLPVLEGEPLLQFAIVGQPSPRPGDVPWAYEANTLGDYIRAVGVPLVEGRMLRPEDRASNWAVALVSRAAARRYWPAGSPIGQRIRFLAANGELSSDVVEIVGVVDNVIGADVTQPPPPRIYLSLARRPLDSVAFVVRGQADSSMLASAARDAARAADRDLAVSAVRRFDDQLNIFFRTNSLIVGMFGGFAAIGFIVALTGIYGVTAFAVGQRRHEIGVRVALGATSRDVIRLIVGRTVGLMTIGTIFGLATGWALARTMRSFLFQTSALDPLTYLTVIALLALCGLVASYVPARRAVSIDPVAVLKRE